MPLYDYLCPGCGGFRQLRPMTQAGEPAPCPLCGAAAKRVLAAPFLGSAGTGHQERGLDRHRFAHVCGGGCTHAR
jgi:putative FmdB family regulatory protein